jgi:hypothetical protein
LILTHLSAEALAQIDTTACEVAQDGMTVEI